MSISTLHEINISNLKLDFNQLLNIIRQLDPAARSEVAQVLLETDVDTPFAKVLEELSQQPPVLNISDLDIDVEIRAIRQDRH